MYVFDGLGPCWEGGVGAMEKVEPFAAAAEIRHTSPVLHE